MKNARDRVPTFTKLAYGAGDFGFSFTDTALGVLFAIFLVDVVGLVPRLAALAVFIGKSWDYINDLLIGYLVDRTRSRWGRRRPYLLFGFIPFGVAFAMLWWRPPFESQWALAIYYAAAYFVYDTILTVVSLPFFALTPELTQDYDERTSLTSYRMAFSLVGGLVAFIVPLMIIGTMRPENTGKVFQMGVIFAIASSLPLLITFFGTREREEYAHQEQPTLRESLRAARRNRPFLFAAGIFLFTWTAIEIIQNMLLFFLKYRMDLEAESDIVAGAVFVTAIIVLPFWVWASQKTDKRKSYIYGMLFLSAVMLTLIFIDPSLGFNYVISLAALAGFGVSAVHVLTWAMIPDAVEVDELESGARHEGMFYALVSLFKKVASSISIPLTLLVLDWSGFISNASQQPESAVWAIRILMGPVPSLFLLGGILFAVFYPLSRESHAKAREEIAARREAIAD
ncbi:MAG: MFS transporter [Anaerolineales bacterium]|nr:MAG: MFS transporter [Anaerolineales bacterium]